jgi:hypothetical protein
LEKVKNTIIVVLSVCLVGAVGYILGKASIDQPPVVERNTQVLRKNKIPGDNTVSHKVFEEPILAWVTGGRAQVAVIGVTLNKVDERLNELLFLFKIQIKDTRFCIDSTKRVIRQIVNDEGVSAAATDSSKTCGDPYTTLNDQWLAFEVGSGLREFAFVLPPTSAARGATPTGLMYVSVLDADDITIRLELDATPKTRDRFMPDDPI